jgi:hypothetical protein
MVAQMALRDKALAPGATATRLQRFAGTPER